MKKKCPSPDILLNNLGLLILLLYRNTSTAYGKKKKNMLTMKGLSNPYPPFFITSILWARLNHLNTVYITLGFFLTKGIRTGGVLKDCSC